MNNQNTRRGNTQQVINKNCHFRGMLSGIPTAFNDAQGGDPRTLRAAKSGMTRHRTTARGFTLIELLVVVLIIGILAAVALPQYQFAVAKSRFTQAKVIAQSLAEAEEVYYLANGKYTQDFNDLDITIGGEISEIPAYRFYKWGKCSLSVQDDDGRAEVVCWVDIPSGQVTYWVGLQHSTYDTRRKCLAGGRTAFPAATDISYRICESETQNTQKVVFGGSSYGWTYK